MEPPFCITGRAMRIWPKFPVYECSEDEVQFRVSRSLIKVPISKITPDTKEALSPEMPKNSAVVLSDDRGVYALYSDSQGALSERTLEEIPPLLGEISFLDQPITIPLGTKRYGQGVIQDQGEKVTIYRFDGEYWGEYVTCEPFNLEGAPKPTVILGKVRLVRNQQGHLSLWTSEGEISIKVGVDRFQPEQFYGVQYDDIDWAGQSALPPNAVILEGGAAYSVVQDQLTFWESSDEENYQRCWVAQISDQNSAVDQTFDNQAMVGKIVFVRDRKHKVLAVQLFNHKLLFSPLSSAYCNCSQSDILPQIPTITLEERPRDRLIVCGGWGHYQGMRVPIVKWPTQEEDDLKRLAPIFGRQGQVALVYSDQQRQYCVLIWERDSLQLIPCDHIHPLLKGKLFVRRLPKDSMIEVDPYPPLESLPMYDSSKTPSLVPHDIHVGRTEKPSLLKVDVCSPLSGQGKVIYTFDVPMIHCHVIVPKKFRDNTLPGTFLIFWDLESPVDPLKIYYHNPNGHLSVLSFTESIQSILAKGDSSSTQSYQQFLVAS